AANLYAVNERVNIRVIFDSNWRVGELVKTALKLVSHEGNNGLQLLNCTRFVIQLPHPQTLVESPFLAVEPSDIQVPAIIGPRTMEVEEIISQFRYGANVSIVTLPKTNPALVTNESIVFHIPSYDVAEAHSMEKAKPLFKRPLFDSNRRLASLDWPPRSTEVSLASCKT
ncbi:hypothetical protein KI387_037844, partial [Taxus chinensis]